MTSIADINDSIYGWMAPTGRPPKTHGVDGADHRNATIRHILTLIEDFTLCNDYTKTYVQNTCFYEHVRFRYSASLSGLSAISRERQDFDYTSFMQQGRRRRVVVRIRTFDVV